MPFAPGRIRTVLAAATTAITAAAIAVLALCPSPVSGQRPAPDLGIGPHADPVAPPPVATPPVALLPLVERSHWATRIVVDRREQSVVVSRELMYDPSDGTAQEAAGGDVLLIGDERRGQQISLWDHSIEVGDLRVRISLHRYGPPEGGEADPPDTSTEITLWINGQARLIGFLEDRLGEGECAARWERIVISRRGGALSASAIRASCFDGGRCIVERGSMQGNLGTSRPWIALPSECFDSSDGGDTVPAGAASTTATAVACRDTLRR